MDHVSKVLGDSPQSIVSASQSQSETPAPAEPLTTAALDRLWLRMTEIYGHRFTSSYGTAPSSTWAKGLAGLTGAQIAVGIGRCLSGAFAWPPTLPEFRALCLPRAEDLGIPSLEAAWSEALDIACQRKRREDCSHPVVWHAYYEAGDIGHMNEDKGRKVFEYAYAQAVAMALAGEALAPIPKALPPPEQVKTNYTPEQRRAAADAAMQRLRAIGFKVGQQNNESEEQSP